MKFALGTTALLAVGASAFAPAQSNAGSSALFSTATKTYTFTKSEEIFAEAKEVGLVELQQPANVYARVHRMLTSITLLSFDYFS